MRICFAYLSLYFALFILTKYCSNLFPMSRSNKKMDDMKSELLAESKQNHLKTRAEIKRNTNADGAKTRKDISAQLSKMQKEYAVNLEQMERNLQRTIMNRLGHPPDIYAPRRTRYTRKAAQKR